MTDPRPAPSEAGVSEHDAARRAEESRARVLAAEALLQAEAGLRDRTGQALARLRAWATAAFLLIALVFGYVADEAAWRAVVAPLGLLAAWAAIASRSRTRPALRGLFERAAPFVDLLLCVLIALQALSISRQPQALAGVMAAVMAIPVAFAGLTLSAGWIGGAAAAGCLGIALLQWKAGLEPGLVLAAMVPTLVLGAIAGWAARRLRKLADGLVSEQAAKQLGAARRAELEAANERMRSLSDELGREHQRLIAALADTEALTRLVAHDMKQPLATIQGLVELVADDLRARHPAEHRLEEDLRIAHGQGQRLLGLITDLLSISRLEKGALVAQRRRLRVAPLLESAARAQAVKVGAVRIEVAVGPELEACVDRELVERLLHKLVANALGWVRPGGLVRLSARREGEWLALRVANDGPQVPESLRPQLFRKFQTSPGGNSGLGLYLCWLIAQAHAGSMELEEGQELAVSFVARLPAERPEDTPPPLSRVI